METFTAEFRASQPGDDAPDEVETRLAALTADRVSEMDGYLLSPVSKLPSKVGEVVVLGTYRVVELSESAIREMNRRHVVSSCLLVRGAFETACLVFELVRRVEDFIERNDSNCVGELQELVDRTLLGSKSKDHALFDEFASINVLTHIQKLSKTLDAPFSGFYDRLSEYCHPNAHGMIGLYTSRHDAAVTQFTHCNELAENQAMTWCLAALAVALGLMKSGCEQWESAVDHLATLAEDALYHSGTWPSDTPYPVTKEMRAWLRAEAVRMLADKPTREF